MKQLRKTLLAVVLVLITLVTFQLNDNLSELTNRIDLISADVYRKLDLSVLDSCGVITDGTGHGSCVFIRPDLILTAGHCIDIPGTWIEIGGVQYRILSKWRSTKYDVGFAEIEGELPCLGFAPMPSLLQEVYLIGSPYAREFANTITKGIISRLEVDFYVWQDLIQTDAEGAPGSSGCPLLDESGGILGICVSGPNPGGGVTLCEPVSHIIEALKEYDNDRAGMS